MKHQETHKHPKILLVDDNPDHLAVFRMILEGKKYSVLCAEGAEEAFGVLDSSEVDVIVCDVMMPKINGPKFVEELRLNEKHANIPIIMITAGCEESEVDLLLSGADLFCPKNEAKKLLDSQIKLLLD